MVEPLLLGPPYGYGAGEHISLRTSKPIDDQQLEDLLLGFSCYPPAIPKIKSCLKYSGRYDCVVQASWFLKQKANLGAMAKELGLTVLWYMHEDMPVEL